MEAEVDRLVYSLYGLTRDEIAIIEESLQERRVSREVADDEALEPQTWADMECLSRKSVLKVVKFLWSLEGQKTSISTD